MQWSWPGEDAPYGPSPTVAISGNKLIWDLEVDHDTKRSGDHAEQSFEDFRTYGPAWPYAPPEIIAKLTAQPGLENPPWLTPGYDAYSPAWNAIAKGDESLALASLASEDPRRKYRHNTTLLMHAAANRMEEVVDYLLRSGVAEINAVDELGQSALVHAATARNGSLAVVQSLLDAGAGPLDKALDWAIWSHNADICEELLKRGAHLTDLNNMLNIARNGWLPVMRLLLASGADVNFCNRDKSTSLMWARTPEMTQLLLDSGADPNFKTASGDTALTVACAGGNAWKVELLLKAGGDPNARGHDYQFHLNRGKPILQCLLGTGKSPEIVALLRAAGAS